MRKSIVRSFLVAQALVGVVLTGFWLAGTWEPRVMALPLAGIGIFLLLCAFIPISRFETYSRLGNMAGREESPPNRLPADPALLSKGAARTRLSVHLIFICGFLVVTALLLYFAAPMPGA